MHVMALHARFVWIDLIACSPAVALRSPTVGFPLYPLAVALRSPTVRPQAKTVSDQSTFYI